MCPGRAGKLESLRGRNPRFESRGIPSSQIRVKGQSPLVPFKVQTLMPADAHSLTEVHASSCYYSKLLRNLIVPFFTMRIVAHYKFVYHAFTMEIIRANVLGFCTGVQKAVDAAEKALDDAHDGRVFTLGPLIHNPVALKSLADRGLAVLSSDSLSVLTPRDTVLIRAHGVPPEVERALENKGCAVVNATCPRVTVSQQRAADYASRGYTVILAGDKNHGEVTGIAGYAEEALAASRSGGTFILVQNRIDAEKIFDKKDEWQKNDKNDSHDVVPLHAVLLSQTTFSPEEFAAIAEILKKKIPSIEIFNTICPATRQRQEALAKLCTQVDGVIVIGGRNSANTNRLFVTAKKLCAHAALIETPDEIPEEFYHLKKVGLTAGASTPESSIHAVEDKLRKQNTAGS